MASALKLPPPHTDTPNALLAQEGVFPVPPGKYREIPLSSGGIYLSARSPLRRRALSLAVACALPCGGGRSPLRG